jgi:hypothetical protein
MIEVQNPYRKEALTSELENTHSELSQYFSSLSTEMFFERLPDKWSPSENLVHLIKSQKALSSGLKLPKIFLKFKFGKPKHDSRLYPKVREVYLQKLANGADSPEQFLPDDMLPASDFDSQKEQVLTKWDEIHTRLINSFERWKERDLDRYVLPHPIMGSLTIREMMMFTIYHNVHHLTNVQKSIEKRK